MSEHWLYIFSGFPKTGLNAGGLQHCIENVEELGLLEHGSTIQLRKEGIFIVTEVGGERQGDFTLVLSPALEAKGITWNWFYAGWCFGNGVTIHKTLASPEYKTVVHGTNLSLDEFLAINGSTKLADLELSRKHIEHEGWEEYKARWKPGTCPSVNHVVHLTWLITTHPLNTWAYRRIRDLVEGTGQPEWDRYRDEHVSVIRRYDGKPAFHRGQPNPSLV